MWKYVQRSFSTQGMIAPKQETKRASVWSVKKVKKYKGKTSD